MSHMSGWIQGVLSTTPERWQNLAQTLPAELMAQPPAAGQWSAHDCLQHLVDTERVFRFRLKAFLEGRDSFPAFNPDAEGSQLGEAVNAVDLAAELAFLREDSLKAIAALGEDGWERRARHQELGMVSLGEMLHEWAAHDLNHTVQAERALMQPFIRGSGAWQRYFTDHQVKTE
jgi:hypothetical protein